MTVTHFFAKRWILPIILTACFILADHASLLTHLEWQTYDQGIRHSVHPVDKRIVLIAVDEKSIATLGHWPWNGQHELQLIRTLARGGPKLIVDTRMVVFNTDQVALDLLEKAKNKLDHSHYSSLDNPEFIQSMTGLEKILVEGIKHLNVVDEYAKAVARTGTIILAMQGIPLHYGQTAAPPLGEAMIKHAITATPPSFPQQLPDSAIILAPPQEIAGQALALGMNIPPADANAIVRTAPLAYRTADNLFPSLALIVAAKSLGIQRSELQFQPNKPISLGQWAIPHDQNYSILTCFYHDDTGKSPFPVHSFIDVLEHKVPATVFRNQIVLIGLTTPGLAIRYATPLGQSLAPVELLAHEVATLLNQDALVHPTWALRFKPLLYAICGLILMFILPMPPRTIGLLAGLGLASSCLLAEIVLMVRHAQWIPLTGPALLLLSGTGILAFTQRTSGKRTLVLPYSEADDSNRMLGLALQGQGRFDLAFERFRLCRTDELTLGMLYHLVLDLENNRRFNEAIAVLEYLEQKKEGFRDCTIRLESNRAMAAGSSLPWNREPSFAMQQEKLSLLDRYRLEEELGKGLFGTVWHGHDDHQHREVAIKIIPLQERFPDEKSFSQAKSMFNRMADQCLALRHPNIIKTEETQILEGRGVLVMEIHDGHSLEQHMSPKRSLALPSIIQMIAKIAMALDHAHRLQIFHGNLRPGNIIFNEETQEIKIAGFGQAMLLEAIPETDITHPWKRTTSYLSPEQQRGDPPGRRSDIYALGMIFAQLILGTSTPAQQIGPETFPDGTPECLIGIIQKCLAPQPEQRFINCIDLAKDLVSCIKSQINP
ncbi:MAG: CHASE2 domain-containing protein [Magnetococcales bacterium]|nr:CHASE2 domain-containing protein [Magnetococcales bacterium]MBF0148779.1 CHASE2 domain-containing protein [Magnetococcales bacterium]